MPGSVTLDVHDAIAIITIENKGRLNAMDDAVAAGLAAGIAEAKAKSDIGALVLRGAGSDAFCSGVDLKFAAEHSDRGTAFAKVSTHIDGFLADMADLPFPSIAMLHGVCYGGGVQLAMSADFRFAGASLRLAVPALKNGLLYPIAALERMMRLIGPSRTRRLILEGVLLPPERLLGWGLIDEIHRDDELEAATLEFAARLAAQPRAVMPHYMKILRALDVGDGAEARRLRKEAGGTIRRP